MPGELAAARQEVRSALLAVPEFSELAPDDRERLAGAFVRVCHAAAQLGREQAGGLAVAQSAGTEFSGVSAEKMTDVTRRVLNAVSFPRFVTELITGVFKAILDSNQRQLDSFVDLLNNVAATNEGFADSNLGPDRARAWLADRYPASFEVDGGQDPDDAPAPGEQPWPSDGPPEAPDTQLRLRPGASPPSAEALRTDLGLGPDESVPTGDPERVLVPLARRRLAKMRQEMLSTMVMLGLQRLVVDSGRINAAMRFHIDTRSAAVDDRGSTFDARHTSSASGTFGTGIWGASASMQNTIGFVTTQSSQSTEEMNTDLDLNSSVEVVFHSDYLPLNRMATDQQVARIRENSRNAEAEEKAAAAAREGRTAAAINRETERGKALAGRIAPPQAPPPPRAGEEGSVERAKKAQADAAAEEKKEKAAKEAAAKKGATKKPEPKAAAPVQVQEPAMT
jgi:hypothetical protein